MSIFAVLAVSALLGPAQFAPGDVPKTHWAYHDVDEMFRLGLLDGYAVRSAAMRQTASDDTLTDKLVFEAKSTWLRPFQDVQHPVWPPLSRYLQSVCLVQIAQNFLEIVASETGDSAHREATLSTLELRYFLRIASRVSPMIEDRQSEYRELDFDPDPLIRTLDAMTARLDRSVRFEGR